MDFAWTPEQELLRHTARDVLAACASPERVRAMIAGTGLGDAEWSRIAALGWPGLLLPMEHGGSGLGMVELVVVLEEMGRAVLPGPFLATVLGADAIRAAGGDAQRERWLPALAEGRVRATLAVAEESGRWEPSAVAAAARHDGATIALAGTKRFVADAADVDLLVVAVRRADDGTLALATIDRGAPGLEVARVESVDGTRRVATVALDGVRVAADALSPGGADGVMGRLLDRARIAVAADACGGAERVLELTVEYAKVREQFGRPIGSFQAIQHQCADMLVEVEKAKATTYYAAYADAAGLDDAPVAAASAKAIASDAYRFVTARAVQVHGGIGFTWEHDLHLYYKRALSGAAMFGDATFCRELVAQRLGL